MLLYYLRLAILSFRQSPMLTALIVVALALGIGLSMTIIGLYKTLSGDPIPEKSDSLYAVRIDNYALDRSFDENNPKEPPWQLAYQDATGLLQSEVPTRQAAMFKSTFIVDSELEEIAPFRALARITNVDFFPMFSVPFLYGGPWSKDNERNADQVVVLKKSTNDRLFGGENSVGKSIKVAVRKSTYYFTVVGVLDDWDPMPKFYDVNNGAINLSEDLYMPFSLSSSMQMSLAGNTHCWKSERVDGYNDLLLSECTWIQYWVELNSSNQLNAYSDWLDAYTLEQKKLGRLQRPINNRIDNVMAWLRLNQVVPTELNVLIGLSLMFLLVCIFNAISLLISRFYRKASIIGVRRALGASKGTIFSAQLVEVTCIGLLGGILGLALTWVGFQGLRKLLNSTIDMMWQIDMDLVLMTLALAIGSALIAGIYPAWRISRISPAFYLKTQ